MALTIEFGGDDDGPSRIDSIRPIDMRALPSDSLDDYSNRTGMWIELRDLSGRVVYRRVMYDDTRHLEGPRGIERRITRLIESPGTMTLRVVVPELPGARRVVLVRSRSNGERAADVAQADLPSPI